MELEGAKHYVYIDEQSWVAAAILAFLSAG